MIYLDIEMFIDNVDQWRWLSRLVDIQIKYQIIASDSDLIIVSDYINLISFWDLGGLSPGILIWVWWYTIPHRSIILSSHAKR